MGNRLWVSLTETGERCKIISSLGMGGALIHISAQEPGALLQSNRAVGSLLHERSDLYGQVPYQAVDNPYHRLDYRYRMRVYFCSYSVLTARLAPGRLTIFC